METAIASLKVAQYDLYSEQAVYERLVLPQCGGDMQGFDALMNGEVVVEPTRLRFPVTRRIGVELSARMIGRDEGFSPPICPHCDGGLNLHQPDESLPDQLLGTCDTCFRWYCLVELGKKGAEVLMIELPSKSVIEAAFSRDAVDQGS
jgi:hypothetical protein